MKTLSFSSNAGFTLLEVMVAVAIIAISFVSLIGSQTQSISIAEIARFETSAAMLARGKIAELEIEEFETLSSSSGEFEGDFAGFNWQTTVEDLTEEETDIVNAEEMLKLVNLTVSQGAGKGMSYQVSTVIMKKIEPAGK